MIQAGYDGFDMEFHVWKCAPNAPSSSGRNCVLDVRDCGDDFSSWRKESMFQLGWQRSNAWQEDGSTSKDQLEQLAKGISNQSIYRRI